MCVPLSAAEGNLRNASRHGERPLNRRWETRNSRLFFFSKMVRSEGHTDQKGEWVCVWVSAVEARKAEARAPYVTGERQRPF